jgi:PhzF family phenazine biosynthesis protein
MQVIKVYHYDAFSSVPGKGNPAGVVWGVEELSDKQMQEVAARIGFNETAFVLPSAVADWRLRYFTPGHEMNLCGHGTVATLYALAEHGFLQGRTDLTVETLAGILPMKLDTANERTITMQQTAPQFQAFNGSLAELAAAMGIEETDIDDQLPTLYGSTGTWTLLVPIRKLATFDRMKPDNSRFPAILREMPQVSLHPFCLETYDPQVDMHARHFSSPYSGTVEDPVTGTASGVMGAYYARFIDKDGVSPLKLKVEQGYEIGREGQVEVTVSGSSVAITGTAVYVKEIEVSLA